MHKVILVIATLSYPHAYIFSYCNTEYDYYNVIIIMMFMNQATTLNQNYATAMYMYHETSQC